MEKIRLALVGTGGYGAAYIGFIDEFADKNTYEFVAAIDPYAEKSSRYQWILDKKIPIYNSLEEFYAKDKADLVIVSTPIKFHKTHTITAMANGSHVLCEKPLVAVVEDMYAMEEAQKKYNKLLGVGFQLSYCKPILALKQDIIDNKFGKAISFKSYSSWRRYDNYYGGSDWKGRVCDDKGNWILDSISTNATAHYLFNMFFMAGSKIETSAMPVKAEADIYRAKDIQSYDTCFIRGEFADGCKFFYFSTHSGESEINPIFEYKFENAVVTMNEVDKKCQVIAHFNDGTTKNYGDALNKECSASKVQRMIDAVSGKTFIPCTIETVKPHVIISNAIFDQADISEIPQELRYRTTEPAGSLVKNLVADSLKCYESMSLPHELGLSWASKKSAVLDLSDVKSFSGKKFI